MGRHPDWRCKDVGDLLGVTKTTVARWRTGMRHPTVESMRKIEDLVGWPLQEQLELLPDRRGDTSDLRYGIEFKRRLAAATGEQHADYSRTYGDWGRNRTVELRVLRTIGELAGLPEGTRIATNRNKLLVLEQAVGGHYWFEEGELTPYSAIIDWLPVIVLPPVSGAIKALPLLPE
jgi:transcriptional regulator with XRE-family HTH domain